MLYTKSNLLTMNFLNVAIHLIIKCINLMFSLSYQQERSQEWRRDWRKKLQSGIAMTLYIVLIVTQLYSYEKIKSKDIQNLFSVLYLKGKKCFVRSPSLSTAFFTAKYFILKEMFNCIKPLYIIINCENRTAEMMWCKNGLSLNNL